jgi:hypothetical protein
MHASYAADLPFVYAAKTDRTASKKENRCVFHLVSTGVTASEKPVRCKQIKHGVSVMKTISRSRITLAALSMALCLPGFIYAQSEMNSQSSLNSSTTPNSNQMREARQMVPARAYLLNKLDANEMKPGAQFEARLSQTVHLKNGTELPKNTQLVGTVSTDDMQLHGTSKLALRITEARLRDGKMLPVKATIVGLYAPETENDQGYVVSPGDEEANGWNQNELSIHEVNAISGVDLHSRIDGSNSGVFVATKKDNVKIAAGSELALALAPANSNQTGSGGGN